MLEALELVELVYVRGNYKLYRLSSEGEKLVKVLEKGGKYAIEVKTIGEESEVETLDMVSKTVNIAEAVS